MSKEIIIAGNFINSGTPEDIYRTIIYHNGSQPTVSFGDVGQNDNAKLIGVSIYSQNTGVQFNNTDATLERCLLFNPIHGSGIVCYDSSPSIINCTVRGFDSAVNADDESNPNIKNSILWSDEIGLIGPASISYSCIKLGLNFSTTDLGGNIYSDPIFDFPWYDEQFGGIGLDWRQKEYPWIGYPMGPFDGKDNNPGKGVLAQWVENNNGELILIGNGEPDHGCSNLDYFNQATCTGAGYDWYDPDGDGVAGEDWFNGYDDDGDGLIDEDYFEADGIDNDGDGFIDEEIDRSFDQWYDGVDNDHNGIIDDEVGNVNFGSFGYWGSNIENNILIEFGRKDSLIGGEPNPWYVPNLSWVSDGMDLMGDYIYDEDLDSLFFDVYIYDFGEDGLPGDPFIDTAGDGEFQLGESLYLGYFNEYLSDCGLDGICYYLTMPFDFDGDGYFEIEGELNPNWTGPDADGTEGNGIWEPGDGWIDSNGNGQVDIPVWGSEGDSWNESTQEDYNDVWPLPNGVWDEGEAIEGDYGQDGLANTGDPGEGDGIFIAWDSGENDGVFDMGDGIYGYEGETYDDNNNNGIWDVGENYVDENVDSQFTPADYVQNWVNMPGLVYLGMENYNPFYWLNDGIDNDGDGIIDENDEGGNFPYTLFRYFKLKELSPAIDTGNPNEFDLDGTIVDMGALYYNQSNPGCMDPLSPVYDPYATVDDNTCEYFINSGGDTIFFPIYEFADGLDNDDNWEPWAYEFGWDEDDIDGDGNFADPGEWGFVVFDYDDGSGNVVDTAFFHPWQVLQNYNGSPAYQTSGIGIYLYENNGSYNTVGVDEWHQTVGLYINPVIDLDVEVGVLSDNGWEINLLWEEVLYVQPGFYSEDGNVYYNIFNNANQDVVELTYNIYKNDELIAEEIDDLIYIDYEVDGNEYVCYRLESPEEVTNNMGSFWDVRNEVCLITPYLTAEMGDVNNDGYLNILDVVQIVNVILGNAEFTDTQMATADFNQDGTLDILDVVQLVNYIMEYSNEFLSRSEFIEALEIGLSPTYIYINAESGIGGVQINTEGEYTITEAILPEGWEYYSGPSGFILLNMTGKSSTSEIQLDYTGDLKIINHLVSDLFGNIVSSSISSIPDAFVLKNAYPNPFNPTTTLSFAIPVDSEVSISIYNLQGREVSTLISGNIEAGYHSVVWDSNSYASGVYFVKMVAGEYVTTQKLMLVK